MLDYPFSPVHSQVPCDRPEENRSCISNVDAALAMLYDAWTVEMVIMPSVLLETADRQLTPVSKGVMHQ